MINYPADPDFEKEGFSEGLEKVGFQANFFLFLAEFRLSLKKLSNKVGF